MNIDDITTEFEVPAKIFPEIFAHQRALEAKYLDIERKNGFYFPDLSKPAPPIDDAQYQAWLKSMFWRVTEEIAEACEKIPVLKGKWIDRWDIDSDLRHFWEEIADAIHFLVAASIPVGINCENLDDTWEIKLKEKETLEINNLTIKAMCFNVIALLGLCGNTLKNKPWKISQMTTDVDKLFLLMNMTWLSLFELLQFLDCPKELVYVLYMKKNSINSFRQKTNY